LACFNGILGHTCWHPSHSSGDTAVLLGWSGWRVNWHPCPQDKCKTEALMLIIICVILVKESNETFTCLYRVIRSLSLRIAMPRAPSSSAAPSSHCHVILDCFPTSEAHQACPLPCIGSFLLPKAVVSFGAVHKVLDGIDVCWRREILALSTGSIIGLVQKIMVIFGWK
jgi:hypothetical protein